MSLGLKKIFKKKGSGADGGDDMPNLHAVEDDIEQSKSGLVDEDEEDLGDQSNGEHVQARLSLDGDLVERQRQKLEEAAEVGELALGNDGGAEAIANDPEGTVHISSEDHEMPVKIGGCGSAGWEPLRGPNRRNSVEIRKENQDAYCAHAPFMSFENQLFFGVFDGHGAEGRKISHFARDNVTKILHDTYDSLKIQTTLLDNESEEKKREVHKARATALRKAFGDTEAKLRSGEQPGIDALYSGTTTVVCWFHGPEVYCGWVGDSRCILARRVTNPSGKDKFKAVDLSYDQKPTRPDEKKRIRAAGGRIARWKKNLGPLRVWLASEWIPGLAMTRSIGDTVLSDSGVVPVPEVSFVRLSSEDSFIVLASDGVWEFMTSNEVAEFVGKLRRDGVPADAAADTLVREAVRRWRRNEVVVDDTTCVIIYLDFPHYSSENTAVRGVRGFFRLGKHGGEKPVLVSPDGKVSAFNPKNDNALGT
mmetsp:Transcript_1628/g.4894  ORF Transcript_1628/g.4894 Transcript_1628/m.4894 type:complete len:478 (+) Transcript_1628:292-1725(+)|eukprot:CAMPEP_0198731322 /NCGR_PEP_ID=MMETSP1475-20131203/29228_1 /TAXON_ID= ORGANISM="Unidentified sp., Strain CCMP1999" /NCGR_SAMPLE_ID=MMETSP1475 /ASSEMBLY_ACC=CAM_ASM_001111 /LENGTH=477 /DNA_ID=CAMNT_0044494277 /DNA_START=252 /DNA_END=1685 /DNA_ORIENTATION=-